MAKTIHQEVSIAGSPKSVYEAIMSSEKFTAMTGGREAKISAEAGGASTMFGGDIMSVNVELVPGQRIVQAWRSKSWPAGVYSIAHFELTAAGKGTKVVFDQAGYPDGAHASLETGWREMYWTPLNAILA
ncbi:MAG: SRPBCC domain-containing protein [Cucumibacter sp.]